MAASKSKTPAAKKRGASTRSRSTGKGKEKDAQNQSGSSTSTDGQAADSVTNKNKQESALFRGGSLAQRTGAEGADPGADATGEITSAAPPTTKEAGRASSPSGDEKPVGGKELDPPTARKAVKGAKVKGLPTDEAEVGEGSDGRDPGQEIRPRQLDRRARRWLEHHEAGRRGPDSDPDRRRWNENLPRPDVEGGLPVPGQLRRRWRRPSARSPRRRERRGSEEPRVAGRAVRQGSARAVEEGPGEARNHGRQRQRVGHGAGR
jgi:hypothetical protein